ncbi:MAG: SagB/ThcOx family dehydrogenase [bacterium]|jgi:SagB-type dehydrogenase family enzyme
MRKSTFAIMTLLTLAALASSAFAEGNELKPIELPEPNMKGGMPLMEALKARSTQREYAPEDLPPQTLSDLLWAAFGINRPDSGKRTAPSAMNWQETEIYVALESGLYLYDPHNNVLKPVLAEDIRGATGMQPFVKDAPVNLVFVADLSKMGQASDEEKKVYSAADVGFISQNVYLFCASEGLATVVRGWFDRERLSEVMKLGPERHIVLTQTVGYPARDE